MTIQQINLGSAPSGAGGDTQRAANEKINQNFSNQTHAASKLVGTGGQEIPLNKDTFRGAHQKVERRIEEAANASDLKKGERALMLNMQDRHPKMSAAQVVECHAHNNNEYADIYRQHAFDYNTGDMAIRVFDIIWKPWAIFYTDRNTNKGTNGVLSEKSPVTHLYHDRVEHTGNEKELQPIKFVKQGVGDYLLKNTTGLAQEGWYIVIPHDANGNPLVAVEYEDNDGDVNVRTYKRKFDYEQAKVVADHDNPMDIPETRWIDLRFNDDPSLYDEVTDEPIE